MISADTPSGCEVICVDDSAGWYGPCGLVRGHIYTVDRICKGLHGEFVAVLADVAPIISYAIPWGTVTVGYALRRFRYLDIPDELTSLLEVRRAPVEDKVMALDATDIALAALQGTTALMFSAWMTWALWR